MRPSVGVLLLERSALCPRISVRAMLVKSRGTDRRSERVLYRCRQWTQGKGGTPPHFHCLDKQLFKATLLSLR